MATWRGVGILREEEIVEVETAMEATGIWRTACGYMLTVRRAPYRIYKRRAGITTLQSSARREWLYSCSRQSGKGDDGLDTFAWSTQASNPGSGGLSVDYAQGEHIHV